MKRTSTTIAMICMFAASPGMILSAVAHDGHESVADNHISSEQSVPNGECSSNKEAE